jgi:hypothetical protein
VRLLCRLHTSEDGVMGPDLHLLADGMYTNARAFLVAVAIHAPLAHRHLESCGLSSAAILRLQRPVMQHVRANARSGWSNI